MKRWIFILILMVSGVCAPEGILSAQSKSISTIWSLEGIGIGYERYTGEGNFIQVDFKAETNDIFMKSTWTPAATLSFTWNMPIAEYISRNGNAICIFAGPGAIGGWVRDNNQRHGVIFGVKGRIGVECRFHERNVAISACLSPELGMHISMKGDTSYMRLYRNGMLHGILPEIGIKYAF